MSRLIQDLKADHLALQQALLNAGDYTQPAMERLKTLLRVKTMLLQHLEKENEELYPALRAAAESDAALHDIVSVYAKDMEYVGFHVSKFLEHYQDPDKVVSEWDTNIEQAIQFGRELERLVVLLAIRIKREETALYPMYEQLSAASNGEAVSSPLGLFL